MPNEYLIIDKLVIPPGMDMDNLVLQVDMFSEEYLIKLQNMRKSPMKFMIEKSYTIKNN